MMGISSIGEALTNVASDFGVSCAVPQGIGERPARPAPIEAAPAHTPAPYACRMTKGVRTCAECAEAACGARLERYTKEASR